MTVGCAVPNIVKIGPKTNVAVDVTVLHFVAVVTQDTAIYVSHELWHKKQMDDLRPNTAVPAGS
jgi:hypothetical protein